MIVSLSSVPAASAVDCHRQSFCGVLFSGGFYATGLSYCYVKRICRAGVSE